MYSTVVIDKGSRTNGHMLQGKDLREKMTHSCGQSIVHTGAPALQVPLAEQYQQSIKLKLGCLVSLLFSSLQLCRVRMLNIFIFLLHS